MDCIYNSGGLCYRDHEHIEECTYAGNEEDCENAEEG